MRKFLVLILGLVCTASIGCTDAKHSLGSGDFIKKGKKEKTAPAKACPDLTGEFVYADQNYQDALTINQSEANGIVTYTVISRTQGKDMDSSEFVETWITDSEMRSSARGNVSSKDAFSCEDGKLIQLFREVYSDDKGDAVSTVAGNVMRYIDEEGNLKWSHRSVDQSGTAYSDTDTFIRM